MDWATIIRLVAALVLVSLIGLGLFQLLVPFDDLPGDLGQQWHGGSR